MGKASSAKKVARAARAGGNRRSGQRRALGFPVAVGIVIVVGLLLVVFARQRRDADAFPRANKDHIHSSIDIYTCVPDTSAASTSTASTTSTTLPTSTTLANPNDVHGRYQPPPTDAQSDTLGIHTHGDGLMHIHPFANSSSGRNATLGIFLDQVGIRMTNDSLILPSGGTFKEGTTKCEGGKDGVVQVAKWDHATDAAKGGKPNQIFTSGFDRIRLGENESFTIAFMPDGSTIPAKPDVADRIAKVSDLGTSTTVPSSIAPSSVAPSSAAPSSGDQGSTASSTAPASSTSSSSSSASSAAPASSTGSSNTSSSSTSSRGP